MKGHSPERVGWGSREGSRTLKVDTAIERGSWKQRRGPVPGAGRKVPEGQHAFSQVTGTSPSK